MARCKLGFGVYSAFTFFGLPAGLWSHSLHSNLVPLKTRLFNLWYSDSNGIQPSGIRFLTVLVAVNDPSYCRSSYCKRCLWLGIPDIDLERTKKCDKRQKFLAFPSLVEQLYLQRWHTHKKLLLWTCIFWSWKCKKQNLCSEWTSNCILSSLSLSLFHLGLFVLFQIATNNPQLEDLEEDTKAQLSAPKWSYLVWVLYICSTKLQLKKW